MLGGGRCLEGQVEGCLKIGDLLYNVVELTSPNPAFARGEERKGEERKRKDIRSREINKNR